MTTTNDDRKDLGEVKLATIQYEDGHEAPITWNDFKELLRKSYNLEQGSEAAESMTADELDILKQVLWFLLEFDITAVEGWAEGAPDDPKRKARTREILRNALQRIIDYLDSNTPAEEIPQAVDEIAKFLEGDNDFISVARPRLIEDFLKINDSGADVTRKFKNSTITFTGRLGLNEQKVAEIIRMAFTAMNPYKATKNLKTLVSLSLTDTMTALGRTINPNNKKMFVRQLTREILPTIAHAHITLESTQGEGVEVIHMEIGGGFFEVSTKKDQILFRLSPEYAQYLNSNSLSQYYRETLRLGSTKDHNELPYYLAIKLQDHYFKDANRQRGTNMILSVASILDFCADTLEYEYILEVDPTHWKRKIKDRLERALNEIQEKGLFSWEYCGAGLKEIPQARIEGADFYEWSKLYITFQLIPEEPDQGDRMKHKQERIEKAKEMKALEDDKTTVEADKIRKRRRRRAAKNSKKGNSEALKG